MDSRGGWRLPLQLAWLIARLTTSCCLCSQEHPRPGDSHGVVVFHHDFVVRLLRELARGHTMYARVPAVGVVSLTLIVFASLQWCH